MDIDYLAVVGEADIVVFDVELDLDSSIAASSYD